MSDHCVVTALPFPLNRVLPAEDLPPDWDMFNYLTTLLEQMAAQALVCQLAADAGVEVGEELGTTLEVLHGYCTTTLAMVKRWEAAGQTPRRATPPTRPGDAPMAPHETPEAMRAALHSLVERVNDDVVKAVLHFLRTCEACYGHPARQRGEGEAPQGT